MPVALITKIEVHEFATLGEVMDLVNRHVPMDQILESVENIVVTLDNGTAMNLSIALEEDGVRGYLFVPEGDPKEYWGKHKLHRNLYVVPR